MPKKPKHKMSMAQRAKQFAPFAALGDLSKAYKKVEEEMEARLEPQYASLEEISGDGSFDTRSVPLA